MNDRPSICPKCGTTETHQRKTRGDWICDQCEHVWKPAPADQVGQTPPAKTRLFLSYGRHDAKHLADRLHADLESRGFEVWQDTRQIRSGHAWDQVIEDGLRSTQIVLALLSRHSVRRSNDPANQTKTDSVCLDEISFALSHDKKLIPLKVDRDCEVPLLIARLDYVDLTQWNASDANYQAGLKRILESIPAVLRGEVRYREWVDNLQPLDFASFLHEKRQDFCGRQWLFDDIDAWRASGKERALLLTGDPGTGKSAIVAELVQRNPGGQVLAYHCCQANYPATLEPARFIRSLAAMIASQLRGYAACLAEPTVENALKEGRCAEDPASAFEEGILRPLHTLPAPAEGIRYLFVDALDEALTYSGRGLNIVDLLVARLERLPGWLRVVATTRKDRNLLNRLRGLRARELDPEGRENQEDLDQFIQLRLRSPNLAERLTASGLPAAWVRRTLLEKSQGNFLYAKQALLGVERDQYAFARLDELPPGLFGLYEDFFKRHWPDETSYAPVGRVLEVIVAAREPLTEEQLARATGLDAETELPRVLRRLDVLVPLRDGCHQVFHQSLVDWLTHKQQRGLLHYASRRRGHSQLSQRGLAEYRGGVQGMSRYALRHLPAHLLGSERWDDLAALLTDLCYLEAKTAAGLVFELAGDFRAAVNQMPREHARRRLLELLEEALRRDIHFIARHAKEYPQGLFQCLWNSCWWYDCPEAAAQYILPAERRASGPLPWDVPGRPLSTLLEQWRGNKERSEPGLMWLRSLRSPPLHLGTAQKLVLQGHTDAGNSVCYSPDGQRLASASSDKTVRVWDASSGAELLQLRGHTGAVTSVCYSPDGQRLASASGDKTVRVWDASSGAELLQLQGHTGTVTSVCFSPDGQRLASASGDKTVRVWDASSGAEVLQLHGHTKEVSSVCFSPDGLRLASASSDIMRDDNSVRVWDARSGAELLQLQGHTFQVCSVCFSPEGLRLASASVDRTVRVWGARGGAELLQLRGHTGWVESVCFSPDGLRLASGGDTTVRVWDARSGAELLQFQGHPGDVRSVCFSPDGLRLASASDDKTVRVWDACHGAEVLLLQGHSKRVPSVCFSPDGLRLASASYDHTVRVWDASSGVELVQLHGHRNWVEAVCFSPDGQRLASASVDHTVRVWDACSGAELLQLEGHSDGFESVCFSPDGQWLASGGLYDHTVRVWDACSGAELLQLQGHTNTVGSVCFSPDGQRLASASNDLTVRVWDGCSGVELLLLQGHTDLLYCVCFSPDGQRLASASYDQTVRVWDASSGSCLEVHEGIKSTDLRAFAVGPANVPWRAFSRGLDTVLEEAGTGHPVARFPVAPPYDGFTSSPSGRTWAWTVYGHIYLVTLEGPQAKLARLVRAALERTGGRPTATDTTSANELIRQCRIDIEQARTIIREVSQQWKQQR